MQSVECYTIELNGNLNRQTDGRLVRGLASGDALALYKDPMEFKVADSRETDTAWRLRSGLRVPVLGRLYIGLQGSIHSMAAAVICDSGEIILMLSVFYD